MMSMHPLELVFSDLFYLLFFSERIDVERAESEIELENRLSEIVLQQLAYM